jgi:hypothetical protein
MGTRSWKPVSYGAAIDLMHHQARRQLGLEVINEQYGLNKKGDQMFGLLTLDTGNTESGLSIGIRQSYNKSLALGVAIGANVFVCDNLCFSGSAFKVVRKNTTNVWRDFRDLLTAQISGALDHYQNVQVDLDKLKAIPCNLRRGYSFLGVALGEGLLTPTQATIAFTDWKTPRHPEFEPRNLWSLYNCVTEGLKKGSPGRLLDRHSSMHDYFTEISLN